MPLKDPIPAGVCVWGEESLLWGADPGVGGRWVGLLDGVGEGREAVPTTHPLPPKQPHCERVGRWSSPLSRQPRSSKEAQPAGSLLRSSFSCFLFSPLCFSFQALRPRWERRGQEPG